MKFLCEEFPQDPMDQLKASIAASGLGIAATRRIARVSRVLGAREQVFLFELRTL